MFKTSSYFEYIIDTMSDGYIIQDETGKIIKHNQAAMTMFGLSEGELLGRTNIEDFVDCIHEDGTLFTLEQHPCTLLLTTGIAQSKVVMGFKHKVTGHTQWVQLNTVSFDNQIVGSPRGVLTTCSDITDLIKRKRDHERKERQLLEIQHVGKIGSFMFDYPTKQSVWTNEMYRIFDMDPDVHPDFSEIIKRIVPEDMHIIENGFEKAEKYGGYTQKFRIMKKGKISWIMVHAKGWNSPGGTLQELHGVCQDITDQVQLELENSFILHSLNLGLWRWDVKSDEITWDDKMCEVYGTNRASFDNTTASWNKMIHPEDLIESQNDLLKAVEKRGAFETAFRIVTLAGETRHVGSKGSILYDEEGSPITMYGICWDRSKEMALESEIELEKAKAHQSAKLALVGEMAGGVAHEINTPLAIINGSVFILKKMIKNGTLTNDFLLNELQDVEGTILRISKIVTGLRNLSRDSSSEDLSKFTLKEVMSDIFSICQEKFKSHGVDYSMNEDDLIFGQSLELRRIQVSQVLLNVLSNAYDAIESSRKDRWVKITASANVCGVRIRITDSGSGIPKNVQDKIFNPFFTTKDIGKGTGLGLSLSRTLIEKNNGKLYIDNECQNTCFVIDLPLKAS